MSRISLVNEFRWTGNGGSILIKGYNIPIILLVDICGKTGQLLHGKLMVILNPFYSGILVHQYFDKITNRLKPRSGPTYMYVGPDLGFSLLASRTILFMLPNKIWGII